MDDEDYIFHFRVTLPGYFDCGLLRQSAVPPQALPTVTGRYDNAIARRVGGDVNCARTN
jgi:hypothetical protein